MIRIAMLLLIAAGVAGFGVIAWLVMPTENATAAAAAPTVTRLSVLVAARQLHPGLLLKPEDITVRDVPEEKLSIGHVLDQADGKRALIGGMVLRNLSPGDVLRLPTDVLRPADHGFLSAVLTPGSRAVSVAVDLVSGAAGLIWPGDRVDLILTQTLEDPNTPLGRRVVAETVLRNVRVIAIDQQLAQGMSGASGDAAPARTVTLEVSSEHAEHVQVATRLGRLSLVVRSAEPGGAVEPHTNGTYAGDVSNALVARKGPTAASTIKVFPGTGDGREFKF